MRRISVAVALLAMLAGACGGGSGSPVSTRQSPVTTDSTVSEQGDGGIPTTESPVTSLQSPSPTATTTTTIPATATPFDELRLGFRNVATIPGQAVYLAAPEGDVRLFVLDQAGRIFIVEDGQVRGRPFLDVRDRVSFGGERGLLGLAFHPRFHDNGRFFVNYTGVDGASNVVEYRVADDPNWADPASARRLLTVDQPAGNHNGGMLAFGPDGLLYVGLGDGGASNDRFGNGQRPDTLLGTILRIDVDAGRPYAVPAGNPFVGGGGAPEVWAYGLRNPWRFSFDGAALYIGDVGQDRLEEVNVVDDTTAAAGLNFGWPIMEASRCFSPASGCGRQGLELPVFEYPHVAACSITGGYVYRGEAIPALRGQYVYSDYCGGWIRSFRWDGAGVAAQRDWTTEGLDSLFGVTSFGLDGFGELYVLTIDGTIRQIVEA